MSEQERKARRQRLEQLRASGVDPYPARVGAWTPLADVVRDHGAKDAEALEVEANSTSVVGRITALRSFGKLVFLRLLEAGVSLQVSARKGSLEAETFAFIRSLDVGDFVRVTGRIWRTQKGELTVDAEGVELLAKSLRPLPEKWHGLQDVEARYRQRYLDLLANPRAREIAHLRSRVVRALRDFMDERDFVEVETPILQPVYGGAAARPFHTHHNALDQTLYLRIADELYLKRLVVGGLDRVYEIGRNFRNEGISRKHNPEFTMLECYQAYADYHDMMDLVREMLQRVARDVLHTTRISYQGTELELSGEWPRRPLCEALEEATGIDVLATPDVNTLQGVVREKGLDPGDAPTWGRLVDDLFSEHVEPTLMQPTFLTDYPRELSPLAKGHSGNPLLVERFELFLGGMEIANAFSELNDPQDQRLRFEEQKGALEAGDEEAHPMDEDFLRALEHGMPPTGGLGIGLDRLISVLADVANLREVILFPHLRPEARGEET
jgi:lysyl-tRNA synthetase class 2